MSIPAELRYTRDHEWARDNGDGTYTVGITHHAQDALGAIVYVELPAAGTEVSAGDRFGTVESTKSVSDLFAPLTGTVQASNAAVEASPESVNDAPYGDGWMVVIASTPEQFGALLSADEYAALVG